MVSPEEERERAGVGLGAERSSGGGHFAMPLPPGGGGVAGGRVGARERASGARRAHVAREVAQIAGNPRRRWTPVLAGQVVAPPALPTRPPPGRGGGRRRAESSAFAIASAWCRASARPPPPLSLFSDTSHYAGTQALACVHSFCALLQVLRHAPGAASPPPLREAESDGSTLPLPLARIRANRCCEPCCRWDGARAYLPAWTIAYPVRTAGNRCRTPRRCIPPSCGRCGV